MFFGYEPTKKAPYTPIPYYLEKTKRSAQFVETTKQEQGDKCRFPINKPAKIIRRSKSWL